LVSVADLAGDNFGDVIVQYASEAGPGAPKLKLSPASAVPGETVSVSGGPGTGSGGQWWGNFSSIQAIGESGITVGGVAVPSSASVAAATYPFGESPNDGATFGPLTAPVLSGSFTVPCGKGTKTVSVTEPNMTGLAGTISATAQLLVTSGTGPAVTRLRPDHGSTAGGTTVTIFGCKFSHVIAVDFGSKPAVRFTINNSDSITAVSPAGTGVVNVVVETASVDSLSNTASQFVYDDSPS